LDSNRPASNRFDPDLADSDEGEFVHLTSAGAAWTIRAELAGQLLPALQLAVDNPVGEAPVETVKTGPHRTVYRLSLAAGEFYLKHFRVKNRRTLLLNALRPTKADLEWRAALRIASLGLPTFEPVALGQIRRGGLVADSFLVSRGIPLAIPLDEFAAKKFPPNGETTVRGPGETTNSGHEDNPGGHRRSELRQRLATALGELTGRLHLAAVEHADFHAANVLVRIGADGTPALWLIDLHRVYFRRTLSHSQRFRNLAFLHQFFAGKSTRSDRLRFYRAYQRVLRRPGSSAGASLCVSTGHSCAQFSAYDGNAERAQIATLENCLIAGAHRGWKRADRAWRRGNRHVLKLDSALGGCRGIAAVGLAWLKTVRDDPEQLFREVLAWHKKTAKHRVARIAMESGQIGPRGSAFIKCVQQQGLVQRWFSRFRDSPVRKAWEFGHALRRRQVDTPRPILIVERRERNTRKCYLLTEAVPDTVNLSEFLLSSWPHMSQPAQRAWLAARMRRLAWQMRRLHDSGFEHRDLKFPNLLVSRRTADARVWLLDLEGMRAWRRLPEARAAQNLARINVSALAHGIATRSDRLRFLKWYLSDNSLRDWKCWWRRISQISFLKVESNTRRGRAIH
jgi:tRNA A-37 threonylcarbamoyl transferase component Bud32